VTVVRRTLLGRGSTLSSRLRVFRTPDAVEVDEIEGYDVTRRRVRFDEVLLVTYHRIVGWPFVAVMLALMTLVAFMGAVIVLSSRSTQSLGGVAVALVPFLIFIALRFALRVDVVTVYGIRTKAEMQFWFRKGKAREAYRQVCRLARERQQRVRNVPVARRPAPPPPPTALPPPLPEPEPFA
jgi:ABC-type long-subunit fatty acid transport system fused permease/ATPase subunit